MQAKDEFGRWGEDLAARHLTELGYEVVDRNWRCPDGEIDIVARHGGGTVFVEVKTRRSEAYGHPLEAVTDAKLDRVRRLGYAWCRAHPGRHGRVRVDLVGIIAPVGGTPRIQVVPGAVR